MRLFGRGKSGGLMNIIRCDEKAYLVWKWRPEGQDANSTSRENAIRYGSTLRVKDGEVAVFVYPQKDGTLQDFIMGPYNGTIKTSNFPVLADLVGMSFGGESPFQAEVYFINLQGNNQVRFAVPYFDVFDPRLPDHAVPIAVRGTLTFNVTDYRAFIKLNRLVNFDLDSFKQQILAMLIKFVKGVVINIPSSVGIPVVQMESRILDINMIVEQYVRMQLQQVFGVNLKELDINALEVDKESPYYKEVRHLTASNTARTMEAQTGLNLRNLNDMQRMNAGNLQTILNTQNVELQRAQKMRTQTAYNGVHVQNLQADVLKTAAQSMGKMGNMGGGSMNPGGMMAGMMVGAAMGQQMAGMVNDLGQTMQGASATPPPVPPMMFFTVVNGTQAGPFNLQQLQQMAADGRLTPQTYVWRQGMQNWALAKDVQELSGMFAPPPPPTPHP